jgi:hypothetical protein
MVEMNQLLLEGLGAGDDEQVAAALPRQVVAVSHGKHCSQTPGRLWQYADGSIGFCWNLLSPTYSADMRLVDYQRLDADLNLSEYDPN